MNAYATHNCRRGGGIDLLSRATLPRTSSKRVEIDPSGAERFSNAAAGSAVERMKAMAQLAGLPLVPGELQQVTIERAARRLGFGLRRTRSFWHAEARRIDADEHDQARARLTPLAIRLARDLETLRQMDAAFYGPQIAHIEQLLRRAGYLAGTPGEPEVMG